VDFQDPDEFGAWWNALQTYRSVSEVPADYIEFSLLQGARSIEVIYMKWDMVDFQKKIVNYSKTKNKEDYKVPLSARALEILKRRLEKNPQGVEWVWHYPDSKTGHIPKDTKHHFHKLEEYGAKYVTTHDLKRTYASAANTLREYKESEINYLLKHKHEGVNEHYFVRNEPLLREIIQKVEDKFLAIVEEYEKKKAA
jgi:integrase